MLQSGSAAKIFFDGTTDLLWLLILLGTTNMGPNCCNVGFCLACGQYSNHVESHSDKPQALLGKQRIISPSAS